MNVRVAILSSFVFLLANAFNAWGQEPACQASGLNSPTQTNSTITLAWNPGCGNGRLLIISQTGGLCTPTDGINYGFNIDYGLAPMVCAPWRSVYMGNGNSTVVTGLSSNTLYSFTLFEYNDFGSIDYRTFDGGISGSFSTSGGGGGGVQAGLVVVSVMSGSVNLAVIPGNDDATLIVAEQGNSVTSNPINGAKYCAQNTFGTGDPIGPSTKVVGLTRHGLCGSGVVCQENAANFTVTNLVPGSNYTFRAYELQGCSTPSYNLTTAAGNPTTVSIPFSEPTVQATGIVGSSVATSSMTVSWNNGNGQSRILVARASLSVAFIPADGTAYSANSNFSLATDFGGGKVLYAGTSNTANITGLTPGLTYFFQVFEANAATFDQYTNYLTSSSTSNPSSITTLDVEPTVQATAYTNMTPSTNSLSMNWINGNGSNRLVIVDDAPFTFSATDGQTYGANANYTLGTDLGSGKKCVYNSSGNAVLVAGLAPATTYYVAVIEYNGTAGSSNYLAGPAALPFTTLFAEPTTQAASLTFTPPTSTSSLTFNWTVGNGVSRIILARAASAVTSVPTDGLMYTANQAFGSGAQVGAGNYVVYDSPVPGPITITNLAAGTVYHFRVFEYNGAGNQINYLTSTATNNPNNATTLSTEPTSPGTNIIFSGVTTTGATLSWTNGNGSTRLVVGKSGAAVSSDPVDGSIYTANATLGLGSVIGTGNYVVYQGTGTSVTVSGLTPATTTHFRVYEFNGTAGSNNYLTSTGAGNPASVNTLFAEPTTQASTITFTTPLTNGFTASWTNGNGTNRIVIIDDAAVTFTPTDGATYTANTDYSLGTDLGSGQKCVYNGSGTSVPITGLLANTAYTIRIFEYNGTGIQSNYLTSVASGNPTTRKTLYPEPANHSATFTATPASSSQNSLTFFPASFITNASGYILLRRSDGNNPTAVGVADGISPGSLPLTAGTTLVTTITTAGAYDDTGLASGIQYNYALIPFGYDGSNNETYNYRTAATIPTANATTFVVEPSTQPTSMVFSAVATTSYTVSFTAPGTAPAGYIAFRKIGSSPTTAVPVDGTTYTIGATVGDATVAYIGASPTFNESPLNVATLYFYDVFAYNGTGGLTNYLTTGPLEGSHTTLANQPTNQPAGLNFTLLSSTAFTVGFTASVGGADGYLVLRRTGAAPTGSPADGSTYVVGGSLTDGTVVSVGAAISFPESSLTSNTTYYYAVFAYNGSGAATNYVTASPLGNSQLTLPPQPTSKPSTLPGQTTFTANWDPIAGITNFFLDVSLDNYSTYAYQNKPVSGTSDAVSGLASGTNYKYRVRAGNAAGQSANSVDQTALTIPATPTSSGPSVVSQSGFTAAWDAVTGAVNYHLDIATDAGFTNFVTGFNNATLSSTTLTADVSGLPPGTTYYYQVRASNGSGTSPSSATVVVPTRPAAPVIDIPPDNRTQNSFLVTWSTVEGATGYFLDVYNITGTPVFVSGYQNKAVSGTFHNVIGLTPQTNYQVVLRAANSSGSSNDSNIKFTQTLKSDGTGDPAPTVTLGTTATTTSVSATVDKGTDPKTIVFYHRKISDPGAHTAEPGVQVASGNYVADVQSTFLDELGMEYYFEVTDFVGLKSTSAKGYVYQSAVNQAIPNLSAGGKMENYRIFSIPIDLGANNLIQDVFASVIAQFQGNSKEKWRLVRYQSKKNVDYPEGLLRIEKGKGYWINSVEPIDLQISGSVIPANQNSDFVMSLEDGWNQIGNPFPFNISWADIQARNPAATIGPLYVYNPSVKFDQSDNLKAWGGGFVRSTGATTISIPVVVARGTGRVMTEAPPTPDLAAERWYLPIKVIQGAAVNDISGIGMSPTASNSLDLQDELSLPRFVNYLELNGYHPENSWTRFMRDVATTASSYTWNLRVESNWDAPEITLSWDNTRFGSNDAQLILFDPENQVIVNMREHNQYSMTNRSVRELKILYARTAGDLQPGFTGVGLPYPNPFSRSVSIPVIIHGNATDVEFGVFDLMGRRIGVLTTDKLEAGIHTLSWDPTQAGGEDIPDGLYVYRIRFSDGSVSQGRIIRRRN